MVAVSIVVFMVQRYEKTSEMQKKSQFSFHFRVPSIFGEAKVTKKRAKCKRKIVFLWLS
jgi:hypothetical protein